MATLPMYLATIAVVVAVIYAHYRLPFHSATRKQLWISRSVLVLVGFAFGWVNVRLYGEALPPGLVFVSAFGTVHVPAAFILFIKRKRGEWK